MNYTIPQAAAELGISRQALSKWRGRAKDQGYKMDPVGVLNPETNRMVLGLTWAQVKIIRIMRTAVGQ